jgi:hypothetical protein
MRLTKDQVDCVARSIRNHLGHNARIWLFGSRLDDRKSSLANLFNHYAGAVSRTRCFMNHRAESELVFEQTGDQRTVIHNDFFQHLTRETGL